MTPGRVAALVIGIPVALALIANSAFSLLAPFAEGRYQVSYTAPVTTKTVSMNSSGGRVTVGPTSGDRVTLSGTAHYSFIRSTFSTQTNGSDTAMKYHCAPLPSSNCGLDATLGVPAGLPITVSTDGGDATVSGISGPATLHSDGGNLTADGVTGAVKLDTNGGNILLNALTAPVTASTNGGNIEGTDVSSHIVTIHTDGGNIRMTGLKSSQVTASTNGGNIEIDFTAPPRNVDVDTSGGNITLVVPPGTEKYYVRTHTDGGTISDPGAAFTGGSDSRNTIIATTGGGNITLRQATQ